MTYARTPERDATLTKMWKAGEPIDAIANALTMGKSAVYDYRRTLQLPPRASVGPGTRRWTPDIMATARRMYVVEGKSAAEIAKAIGPTFTRASIIGIAYRNKWNRERPTPPATAKRKSPVVSTKLRSAPKPSAQSPFGSATTPAEAQRAREKAAVLGASTIERFDTPANDDAIPLLSRRPCQCSWPVGTPDRPANQLCCGQPVPDDANKATATYCAEHAARARSPRQSALTPRTDRRHNPLMQSRGRIMADTLWNGGRAA